MDYDEASFILHGSQKLPKCRGCIGVTDQGKGAVREDGHYPPSLHTIESFPDQ